MRISASEFILFCSDPAENAVRLSGIVPEVELMMDGDAWDHGENGWDAQAKSLKGLGIPFTVHPPAWDVNASAPIKALRDAAGWLNLKAIDFCHEIGATQVVFHPGWYDGESNFDRNRAKDFSYALLEKMIERAKPYGIRIGFENIAGPSSTLFTEDEYVHALDGIDLSVGFLLDTGHANINSWDIPSVIERTSERLIAFHLHDNDGRGDQHLPIGRGTIGWESVFSSMKSLPPDVLCIMEYVTNTPLGELEKGRELLLEKLG